MVIKAIIETIFVLAIACFCAWAGYKITRLKTKAWIISFCVSFPLVIIVILLNRIPTVVHKSVFMWIAQGRNEFIMMAISVPFIFGILIPRLPVKRQKFVVGGFALLATIYFIVPPFLDPALLYAEMKESDTWIENDVCLQTTSYTCGAASAVTALKQHGINATERELAITSYTSRTWGASEHMLARGIEKLYAKEGISCEIKVFDSLSELQGCCPVIVVVKYCPLIDHYITILEVDDQAVLVGDPLSGKERLTYEQFEEKWRKVGIVIKKNIPELKL